VEIATQFKRGAWTAATIVSRFSTIDAQ